MLEHPGLQPATDRLFSAIAGVIADGPRTSDLGGTTTTREVGAAVLRRLGSACESVSA